MSLEPQTTAKVRLTTTKGPIDIELWAKETPITSRRFLNNVLNNRFGGWEFNRIVKDFIVQANGTLSQEPFEDEFHTRIRFNRRGILGCVNLSSRNTNTGEFFITLRDTPELQSKNTAFGKVVGDSIFSVLKISEAQLGEDGETPLYPVKITKCEVLIPYFDDLVEEKVVDTGSLPSKTSKQKQQKKKKAKVKLQIGVDEDEEGDVGYQINVKMQSAHDVLNDKKLAKEQFIPEETIDTVEKTTITNETNGHVEKGNHEQGLPEEITAKSIDECCPPTDSAASSSKPNVEEREEHTLRTLRQFEEKIKTKKHHEEERETTPYIVNDDDFDKLDDSDDSDTDIYAHSLKFTDAKLANEDLLVTIDNTDDVERKRRRKEIPYKDMEITKRLKH